MREDYKIVNASAEVKLSLETTVIDILRAMEDHTKFTVSELANTAMKRFISAHKDFLPPDYYEKNPKPASSR